MSDSGRRPLRQRFFGVGLQGRLMMATAAMVLMAGGLLTYRAIAAIREGFHWTAEAQAGSIARAYAFGLSPAVLQSEERLRKRASRLLSLHPDPTASTLVHV